MAIPFPTGNTFVPHCDQATGREEKKYKYGTRLSPRRNTRTLTVLHGTAGDRHPTFRNDLACRNTTLTARRPGTGNLASHPECPPMQPLQERASAQARCMLQEQDARVKP